MKRPFLIPLLITLCSGLSAYYPLWLFSLRLAAQLTSAMLLVFGGFLLLQQPGWPVLVYAVLMLAFGATNIAALYRLKTARSEPRWLCFWAHICNALLPLAYALGILFNNNSQDFTWMHVLAVATPAALASFAVSQSARFRRNQTPD